MPEYGTREFIQLWQQKGLFVALDSSAKHGRYTREGLRRAVVVQTQSKIVEMRKQLSLAQAMLDRLDQNAAPGAHGAKVDQAHLEANMIELAERVRSFADLFGLSKWFLSEASYRKASIQPGRDGDAGYTSKTLIP